MGKTPMKTQKITAHPMFEGGAAKEFALMRVNYSSRRGITCMIANTAITIVNNATNRTTLMMLPMPFSAWVSDPVA